MKSLGRILIVFATREKLDSSAGGIHKAVIAQIASFHANKIEVVMVTASESAAEKARSMGVEVYCSDGWHNSVKPLLFPKYWKILWKIRSAGVNAVVHHNGRTWAWGGLFFCFIPNVQIFHREIIRPYRFFRKWIALSPAYADELRKTELLGGWRRVSWAPNSLLEDPPPLMKTERLMGRDDFVIGYIGRCDSGKGTTLLIEALAQLRAKGHAVILRFAGEDHPPSLALAKKWV